MIQRCWQGFNDLDLVTRLSATGDTLASWGNKADAKFRMKKKKLEQKIEWLQGNMSDRGRAHYAAARRDLANLLVQENMFWKQRAKLFWLKNGDMSTKFFHQTATARKRKNKITKLLNDQGEWLDKQEDLCNLINDYFTELFTASADMELDEDFLDPIGAMVSSEQNEKLTSSFSLDEFDVAIKQMHPDKSPGPDGFNPAFFQCCWDTIGVVIFREGVK